jgi:hypothetical protein
MSGRLEVSSDRLVELASALESGTEEKEGSGRQFEVVPFCEKKRCQTNGRVARSNTANEEKGRSGIRTFSKQSNLKFQSPVAVAALISNIKTLSDVVSQKRPI